MQLPDREFLYVKKGIMILSPIGSNRTLKFPIRLPKFNRLKNDDKKSAKQAPNLMPNKMSWVTLQNGYQWQRG
jgi:hypothetical protein